MFVQDFSTWYIRRSRDRASIGDKGFLQTTAQVLITLSKLLAPFMPFLSEEIYTTLTGEESVHLTDWPVADDNLINRKLEDEMQKIRQVCEIGHSIRQTESIKVRQPLADLFYSLGKKLDRYNPLDYIDLIKAELNVKGIMYGETHHQPVHTGKWVTADYGYLKEISVSLNTTISPTLKAEGEARDIMRLIQEARKEAGCHIKEIVEAGLPSWPKEWEDKIKKKTLVSKLFRNPRVEIVRRPET